MARPKIPVNEKRSERITLIMTPAEYEGLYSLAQMQDRTINEFCCAILSQVVKKNSAVIESFNADKQKHAEDIEVEFIVDLQRTVYRSDSSIPSNSVSSA